MCKWVYILVLLNYTKDKHTSQKFMLDVILSKLCKLTEFVFTYKFNLGC